MDLMIPRLEKFAAEGMFGEINLLRVNSSASADKSAQFQSQLGFFEVDLVTRHGKVRKVPVAVKLQLESVAGQFPNADEMFFNEVTAYAKVLPGLGAEELAFHPKMFYGNATNGLHPEQDLLILEDLRPQGFKSPKDLFLDSAHIDLAMKKLGQFHGLSYRLKSNSPEKFKELRELLLPRQVWDSRGYNELTIQRGFADQLKSSPKYSVLSKAYKKLTSKSAKVLTESLQAPEEPFAVIIHGDFLKNNVLYKYDDSGNPVDVKFFDFATSAYGDPAVDLSLFLYMHTTEGRESCWATHLKSYWEGVTSVGDPGFTFSQFAANFAKKAVYGYVVSSYFLPLMMHPEDLNRFANGADGDRPAARPGSWASIDNLTDDVKSDLATSYGGDDSTAALRSIVEHLMTEGYLEEYLLHFN